MKDCPRGRVLWFGSLIAPIVLAAVFATNAGAITVPTVPVGNAGNAGDVIGSKTYGSVAYDYHIGKTEVTVGQYVAFLNAVAATDTYGLYNTRMATDLNVAGIARSGSSGRYSYSVIGSANKPVTYVSWGDAARFVNWLHNGQPTGLQNSSSTEDGAYLLNGATSTAALNAVSRKSGAKWFIPSENEWYKAAYHKNDGATGNYWDYPTGSNSFPFSDQPPASGAPNPASAGNFYLDDGIANGYNDGFAVTGLPIDSYSASQNYLTDAGAYAFAASPYGTFDQGGNVSEWNEGLDSLWRGKMGGDWGGGVSGLKGGNVVSSSPTSEFSSLGFRVAMVPEPGTALLALMGGLMMWGLRRIR